MPAKNINGRIFDQHLVVTGDAGEPVSTANPMPVAAAARNCVGRQTLDVITGSVATLTVPNGAVAANIQADGSTISITQDGTTPTATVGSRVDDGMSWYVDTALANVKMIARTAATKVQVCYFDKA